jgi:hypothetical protein
MYRFGLALLLITLAFCNSNKTTEPENGSFNMQTLGGRFKETKIPYRLSDSALLLNNDTGTISNPEFLKLLDSARSLAFGKTKARYTPMVQMTGPGGEQLFVVKATAANNKKVAILVAFDKNEQFGAAFPFLQPDNDPGSAQFSSVEKTSRNTIINRGMRRKINDQIAEGREVFEYDAANHRFNLVMTDIVDDRPTEVINPIDTLPAKHKFSGDYIKDATNIVSVRDGRYPNQLTVFIHTSTNKGACGGEIKADVLVTSATTAIYRQGGDPCVLELSFGKSSVTLREMEGCGSRRGLECSFDGTFPKKKEKKPAAAKPGKS